MTTCACHTDLGCQIHDRPMCTACADPTTLRTLARKARAWFASAISWRTAA